MPARQPLLYLAAFAIVLLGLIGGLAYTFT